MKVYVETNFILELALEQEQFESCDQLIALCEAGKIELAIPVFCVAEAYETLIRRSKRRVQLAQDLVNELQQLSRSQPYKTEVDTLQNITGLLVRSTQEEDARLSKALDRLLHVATIISLGTDILLAATRYRATLQLQPQDSIIFASVMHHLSTSTQESCFLNRNKNDFDDPDIEDSLQKFGCKVLFNFRNGFNYVSNQIKI